MITAPEPKDYLQLHFIVLIWSFTAILGKIITVSAVEIVFYRTMIATIALLLFMYWRKLPIRLSGKELAKVVFAGLLIGAHWILFFGAARVANVSVCLAGMATCSLWTSLLEPIFMRRKLRFFEVLLGGVIIFGLYIIFRFEFNHALGLTMAVVSSLFAAIFSILNGKFVQRHDPYTITLYELGGAFLFASAFLPVFYMYIAAPEEGMISPTSTDWASLAVLALVCTVYAYSVSVKLMKKFSPFALNLTVNLEPVYGIVLAVLIFRESEQMTPGFYAGTLIILGAVLAYPLVNRIRKRRAMSTKVLD